MRDKLSAALAGLALSLAFTGSAIAGSDDIVVENAWSRASMGVSRPGVAYLDIRNTGDEPMALVGIKTEAAMMPQVHRTSTNSEGMSSMAPAGELVIAPGETVSLEPGGLHAMLMRLTAPLTKGGTISLTLIFSDESEVTVEVPILSMAARGPEG